ncbi:DNA-binding GntR family transcriptional regulator [Virgibacillus natechei]|uniref:DNA-binding GntR family transcriptional regulator n=1 Tax=Virgibacillus natechei TaxID=1216297 RepID=A0ABS4IGG3_9BACI|nr:GntR family transcriptional regulator [Virgibacillus natechei]MBP1970036.1 DNA-binding GntR family transcriptional regulator [Virgibacillus natechei]UZD14122.1 GntR family transcriptional regulator [Virgibacillus natechei]
MANQINKDALSHQIAAYITEQIISGELKPGDKLIENSYAETYGISRAPIRDAFYILTLEGLVEKPPRKAALVRKYSQTEIFDLLEIRNFLESLAMKRIVTAGIDEGGLKLMNKKLEEMQNEKAPGKYARLNHSFHQHIIDMSRSQMINDIYNRLGTPLLTVQSNSFSKEGKITKSLKEHFLLIQYLQSNELKKAQQLLEKHNDDVLKDYMK